MADTRPIKVVYILGSGHCGATLLDMILGSHSEMFGVGEMHAAKYTSPCTCGLLARECPLWVDVLGPQPWPRQEIYRPKLSYVLNSGPYLSATRHTPIDTSTFIKDMLGQYRRILSYTHKKILVDSSKEVERTEVLVTSKEIDPVVIHLVRDGRGATWSYLRKYKKTFPYFYMWAFSNLKIELFRRRYTGTFIYLRYSDLVANPESVLRELCEYIGVAYEPVMLQFNTIPHHQIEGNRMRFVEGSVIYKDEKWRRDMPLYYRIPFDIVFGWLNFYYTKWAH